MNHRTLLVALALIAVAAVVVAATDDDPDHRTPRPTSRPGWRHGIEGERPSGPPPSAERIEQLLTRMKTEQPDMHRHLVRLRDGNPRAFKRAIMGIDRFIRRLDDLPEPMRQVLIQQRQDRVARYRLLKQYRAASELQHREELREQIHRLVGRMFDADQTLKEYKVEQLTRELDALKRDLADRVARRDELIDQTVQRLLDSPIAVRPHTRPGR